jgi:serine/threonine protein kinase
MPHYEGETLEQRLKRSLFFLSEGIRVAVSLARALDALHRVGIIHRDVKPDTVILTADGGLRLIDLGVARIPRLEDGSVADILGTPSYMAPELFQGNPGDEASDLYALGVTVYRMFVGTYPYGEVEPFMRPRFTKYASLSRVRPELPVWLDAVLAKAVSVNPAQRFVDVIEFAHELERAAILAKPAQVPKAPLFERHPERVWQIVALALLFILILFVVRDFGGRLR